MNAQTIQFGNYRYGYYSGTGIIDRVEDCFDASAYQRYVIISDTGVPDWIVDKTHRSFLRLGLTHTIRFTPGESNKNLTTVGQLAEEVVQLGADRRTAIVALGGGLTGNVAGMTAGLLFRGIALIHIPTTLMAASDSVLSLKQAVNMSHGKNLLGLFYSPLFICTDFDFLIDLPAREIRSGMCEVVKNLVAILPDQIDRFRSILSPSNRYDTGELQEIIDFCIAAKSTVMRNDCYEKKEGLILEYGHTIGHALELSAKGAYTHGECVAFGMRCAARIGQRLGMLTTEEVELHDELLGMIDALIYPEAQLTSAIHSYLLKDNKRGYRPAETGKVGLVLLERLGSMAHHHGSNIIHVDVSLVKEVVRTNIQSSHKVVI